MLSPIVASDTLPRRLDAANPQAKTAIEPRSTVLPSSIVRTYSTNTNNDQEQWWHDCGPLFGRFLQVAEYDLHQQYQYLLFLERHLIPALGPHPQKWRSTITRSGLPIEYSMNFQGSRKPTLRIGFEPVSILSGSERDPYNQIAIGDLMSVVAKLNLPGFDARLYRHFINDFSLTKKEEAVLQRLGLSVSKGIICSQAAFGFDLKGGTVTVKGYVQCGRKARAMDVPVGRLIAESVRKITVHTGCCDAFALLHDYMEQTEGYNEFTFLSWDCIDMAQSRLKFYGVHNEVTFRKVAEMWTLGGRLESPEIVQGLKLLRQLWDVLDLSEATDCEYTGGFDDGITSGEKEVSSPVIWNFELKPGDIHPQPKFYFPIHGRQNDSKVAEALAQFWASIGWMELASSYPQTLSYL
jgi:DMATS type aromatic prenyltransferase